jgi:hypothetical protein
MYVEMGLPGGRVAECEVDMGSDMLILDETGHAYTRRFATLDGTLHPAGAPGLVQERPPVMFQSIIHDGLVGRSFLSRFAVTFDLARGLLVLAG